MTAPVTATPVGPDPADPSGFLVGLLAQYFKPGMVESMIRTWVPVAVGTAITWVLAWMSAHWHWHVVLSEHASTTVGMVAVGVVTAVYYAIARAVEKRWPKVGQIMISLGMVKSAPVYAGHPAAARAVRVVQTTPAADLPATPTADIPTGPPGGNM